MLKQNLVYFLILASVTFLINLISGSSSRAEEDELATLEQNTSTHANRPDWEMALKSKYNLTDQQLADLHGKGLNNAQIAIAEQLAKSSNKTIEDILKMRVDQKMGWGRIAKELGVPPSEIGHAVSSLRRNPAAGSAANEDRRRQTNEQRRTERQERRNGAGQQGQGRSKH